MKYDQPVLFPLILAAWCSLLLSGCSGENAENGHGKPHGGPVVVTTTHSGASPIQIVCTTGMIADLARTIGGDRVQVVQLMGEGVDPHQYKASTGDVAVLTAADLILYNGLHLEGKMADIFQRLSRKKPTFAVCEYLPPKKILQGDEAYDPHVWFDVSLWSEVGGVVRDVLVGYDPSGATAYQQRATAYQAELGKLHADVRDQLAVIPRERRVLVTAHDAFRYFGRAYDIEVKGLQGISTESEAGVREVNALVEFLTEKKIKAVFVESSVADRNVQALLEGCAARKHKVSIGGELYSDAMGKPDTPAGTYSGMVRHNVETIVKALK